MKSEFKIFTRAALFAAALSFSGCFSSGAAAEPESAAAVPARTAEETPGAQTAAVPASDLSQDEVEAELKKLSEETGKLQLEKTLIESRLGVLFAANEQALMPLQLEKMQLDADGADRAAKLAEEIAGIEEERTELERRLALETARANAAIREKQAKLSAVELESRELQAEANAESLRVKGTVSASEMRSRLAKVAPEAARAPKYLKEPFVDGTLYISDRRIALNDVITPELAQSVCSQIYFYDNQNSEYPIFIVIDSSPGGSVAAGYQIQKAMQSSRAPVYVVVKNFAASMAAVITTTAERSFCFENAIILHHQISSEVRGNLTVMREGVADGELWYRRFAGPVAEKMGISIEELTNRMYAHNSDGDWRELGPRAVELKWVDQVVSRVEETGVIAIENKAPSAGGMTVVISPSEKTDAQGRRFVELPALENPFDFWAIYDKDNYYRSR